MIKMKSYSDTGESHFNSCVHICHGRDNRLKIEEIAINILENENFNIR